MSDSDLHDIFEVSGFRLDRRSRRLMDPDGIAIPLAAKAFDTLGYFVANPGRVLDKQELLDALWPGVVVEENTLNKAISAVRRALGDSRESPRFIATIQGRGYQLVAPVRAVSNAAKRKQEGVIPQAANPGHAPSTSPRTVAALLASTVLALAVAGVIAWRSSAIGPDEPSIAFQENVARSVVARLRETFGLRDSTEAFGTATENTVAWDAYQRARAQMNMRGIESLGSASELLREAVVADPSFIEARLALIESTAVASLVNSPADITDTLNDLGREVGQLRTIAPDDWRVLRISAHFLVAARDWAGAAEASARAMAAAPPSERGCGFDLMSQTGDELLVCVRAREANDPVSRSAAVTVQNVLVMSGRNEEAAAQYRRVQTLPGNDAESEYFEILRLILTDADPATISTHMQRFLAVDDIHLPLMRDLAETVADKATARAVLRRAIYDPANQHDVWRQGLFAQLAAAYDDPQLTVAAWRNMASVPGPLPPFWTHIFSQARRTNEFKALLEEIGLADYWRQSGTWHPLCRPLGPVEFECS